MLRLDKPICLPPYYDGKLNRRIIRPAKVKSMDQYSIVWKTEREGYQACITVTSIGSSPLPLCVNCNERIELLSNNAEVKGGDRKRSELNSTVAYEVSALA